MHARGSGAHGYFECYEPLTELTRASIFAEAGKRTPVFVRFSTVAGERGSTDTARDVRGFAVKFYTDEGNWDLVGNNIPVFFIQDAMKFPGPHPCGEARAPSRHAAGGVRARHVLGFRVADAGIDAHADVGDVGPRDTPQLPHDARLRRAHVPLRQRGRRVALRQVSLESAGRHALAGLGRGGEDLRRRPDFHRRDLWEAIEAGAYPGMGAWACRCSPRTTPSASASTCSTRPRSSRRSWCR